MTNKTQDVDVIVFKMITTLNKAKTWINTFHAILNVDLLVKNVIKTKTYMLMGVDMNVKNLWSIVHAKKIILEILVDVLVSVIENVCLKWFW